ncbi:hypothetical protein [Bartonella sp. TT110JLCBS]
MSIKKREQGIVKSGFDSKKSRGKDLLQGDIKAGGSTIFAVSYIGGKTG